MVSLITIFFSFTETLENESFRPVFCGDEGKTNYRFESHLTLKIVKDVIDSNVFFPEWAVI